MPLFPLILSTSHSWTDLAQQVVSIFSHINKCNTTAMILSATSLLVLMLFKELLEKRLKKKIPFPVPIDLMIVSFSALNATRLVQQ